MKRERHQKILEIIASKRIETQWDLLAELKLAGINTTQATLSRDLRELRLRKDADANGQTYYTVSPDSGSNPDGSLHRIFRESVIACRTAQNLVVIKTGAGLAGAACAAIDTMSFEGLVGSLAGDDTIFLAMEDAEAAAALCEKILGLTL